MLDNRHNRLKTAVIAAATLLLVVAACSEDQASTGLREDTPSGHGAAPGDNGGTCFAANDCSPGFFCNDLGQCTPLGQGTGDQDSSEGPPPPEIERTLQPPASGERYVYIALSEEETLVRIDSETLEVDTIPAPGDPGALRTVPGADVAVLLNRASAQATIVQALPDGGNELVRLPTRPALNQLEISPDGAYAIAYHDASQRTADASHLATTQEVTLLRLTTAETGAIDLTVGFRPSKVIFSADSSLAYVVTEQGISVIELAATTAPEVAPTVPILRDPLTEPDPSEVVIAPSGELALVRQPGLAGLRAVDLVDGTIVDIDLGEEVSDLDLTGDGGGAIAVLRQAGEVAFIDLPADIQDPTGIERIQVAHTIGQATLSADDRWAFLFSNASPQELIMVADLASHTTRVFPLQKGVRDVWPAPDGRTAIVTHNTRSGDATESDDPLDRADDARDGYSIIVLEHGFGAKLQLTDAPVDQVVFSDDGEEAHLLVSDRATAVRELHTIPLTAGLIVESLELGSHPVTLGLVPQTSRVFVAQQHPLGRVSFLDRRSNTLRTLTGFALNSEVIE